MTVSGRELSREWQEGNNSQVNVVPYFNRFGDPGLMPSANAYSAVNFGAREDYNQAIGVGTDDTVAIQAALTFAGTITKLGMIGGIVWIYGRSLVSAPLVVPRGVKLRGVFPPSSTGQGSTANSIYPIPFGEGSGLVGSHTSGPIVLLSSSDTGISDLTIGATSTRRNAEISTGAQNRNAAWVIEAADSAGASIQRVKIDNVLCRDQPADAGYGGGTIFGIKVIDCGAHNCNGHGLVFDDGSLSGRTNKGLPGEIYIDQFRGNNLGGHLLVLGQITNTVNLPYRIRVYGIEGFRVGNNPSILLQSAGFYINAEEVTIVGDAPGASEGYAAPITTRLDYGAWIAGRSVHWTNCRQIEWGVNPVAVGSVSGLSTRDIRINGGYAATGATDSVNFVKVLALVFGLHVQGVSGDFTGAAIDKTEATSFGAAGWGWYYGPTGIYEEWGITHTAAPITLLNLGAPTTATIASGVLTTTTTRVKIATEGAASTDDLQTITAGADGDVLILQTAVATKDVTLKNRVGGADNLRLAGGTDKVLDHSSDRIMLMYSAVDTQWVQIAPLVDTLL